MLEDFHIEYKIKDQNRNLYWQKKDATFEMMMKDVNAFLHKKLQVSTRVMLVQMDVNRRRKNREERMFRGRLGGKDRYQFRRG